MFIGKKTVLTRINDPNIYREVGIGNIIIDIARLGIMQIVFRVCKNLVRQQRNTKERLYRSLYTFLTYL